MADWRKQLGALFFRYRDLLPVPLALALIAKARPSATSFGLGLPLVAAGEGLRLWGLRHIGPTTRTREICADRLVTSGPYQYCRNPLYFANLLKVLGLLVIAGRFRLGLAILGFYLLEFSSLIRFEEAFLAERFPEAHPVYAQSIPAFVPDGRRFVDETSPEWSWAEAFRSEGKTFQSTGALLLALVWRWRAAAATEEGRAA